jgi:formate-dependent phosphoribosylglycinamide formyltransferase (GAR transformylase)
MTLTTPLSNSLKILHLGSGELDKEVAVEASKIDDLGHSWERTKEIIESIKQL